MCVRKVLLLVQRCVAFLVDHGLCLKLMILARVWLKMFNFMIVYM
jgi:hypothetical protein